MLDPRSGEMLRASCTQVRADWKWQKDRHIVWTVPVNLHHVSGACKPMPQEWLQLHVCWNSASLCHHCKMTSNAYLVMPSILDQLARRSLHDITTSCVQRGSVSSLAAPSQSVQPSLFMLLSPLLPTGVLFDLHGAAPHTYKWCSMHIINLGISLWVCGNTLKQLLLDFPGVFGQGTDAQRLKRAYTEYKEWCRVRHVQQPASHNSSCAGSVL